MSDIMHVRQREIERIPDIVIWAGNSYEVLLLNFAYNIFLKIKRGGKMMKN